MDIYILKVQWELFGLRAPAFSWVVSAGLIVYCCWILFWQWRQSIIRQQTISFVDSKLKSLHSGQAIGANRDKGISRHLYDAIDRVFSEALILRPAWQTVSSSIVSRFGQKGEERLWISEDPGEVFNDTIAMGNQGYRNATTIMTGIGLLATFLAILVALLDVRLANNKIQGLDLLIHGLSGKFLSSVVAVACATILMVAEKALFHPVTLKARSLIITVRSIFPRLTPVQMLLDSQREIIDELKSLRGRDDGIVYQLKQSFTRSVEPAFEKMADRFSETLAGATEGRFGEVSESLGGTALLLQQMNSQLALTGNVIRELAETARQTADRETEHRRAQIEQMTGTVGNLMERLEGHTGESMGSMEKALTAITCDMSKKITDISTQMAAVIEKAAESSTTSAREVLNQAGTLSSKNMEQLTQLLEKHTEEMTRVNDLKDLLDCTIRQFTSSMERSSQVTSGMEKLTTDINKNVASLVQVTKSVAISQETAVKLMGSTSGQLDSLNTFIEQQQIAWSRIEASMAQYETIFENVENHARELLSQIARHLGGYSTVTEKHFNFLTTTADNFISQATGRLSCSIDELGEQLDELHSAVNKMNFVSRS